MGLNKRIYTKDCIRSWINKGKDLDRLFSNADILLFCDDWSSNVYENYLLKKANEVKYDQVKKSTT